MYIQNFPNFNKLEIMMHCTENNGVKYVMFYTLNYQKTSYTKFSVKLIKKSINITGLEDT